MSAPRVKMVAALKKKKKKKDDVYLKLTVPTKKEKLQYLCAQTKNNSLSLKWKCEFWAYTQFFKRRGIVQNNYFTISCGKKTIPSFTI